MSAADRARAKAAAEVIGADDEELAAAGAPAAPDGVTGEDHRAHTSRFNKMRDLFAKQKKVRIRLQKDAVRGDEGQLVTINGYSFFIQRGVSVEVPEGVAEVLEQAGLI